MGKEGVPSFPVTHFGGYYVYHIGGIERWHTAQISSMAVIENVDTRYGYVMGSLEKNAGDVYRLVVWYRNE